MFGAVGKCAGYGIIPKHGRADGNPFPSVVPENPSLNEIKTKTKMNELGTEPKL